MIRAHDWRASPLGGIQTWPQSLKTALELMLAGNLPIVVQCGPRPVMFFNDAACGFFHGPPAGWLGCSLAEARPDWAEWGPLLRRVLGGETVTLPETRARGDEGTAADGRTPDEDAWFSPSASPLRDEGGAVSGAFILFVETTARRTAAQWRAQAEAALRAREASHAYLLRLSDALRPLADPAAIEATACRLLGEELGASRVLYADIAESGEAVICRDYVNGVASIAGRHAVDVFGPETAAPLHRRDTLVLPDVATDPSLSPAQRAALAAIDVAATMVVRLDRDGRWVAVFAAHSAAPRTWTALEVALLRQTAERAWAAIQQARAERRLRESEARFRGFAENSADTLWITDAAGTRLEYLSPAFEAMFGQGRDLLMADLAHWLDLVHPEDRAHMRQFMPRALAGEAATAHYRIIRPSDGSVRWLRDTGFPIRAADGTIARVAGIVQDVTDVAAALAALRESEARLRRFGDASSDVLWIRDARTLRLDYISPAAETVYGVSADFLRTAGLARWARLVWPDDRAQALRSLRRVRAGERLTHEFRIRRPADGAVRWICNTDFPLTGASGRVQGLGGIARDVSEQKEATGRMVVLVAELQHRTRNLLAVVRSLADKTMEGAATMAEFREHFRDRLAALSRVQGLLSRLADSERLTLHEVIRAELAALGALGADGQGPQVTLDGPPGVWLRSGTVQTFALALHELATNALKYGALSTASGRLLVRWRIERGSDEQAPHLHLEWRESGVALPGDGTPLRAGYGRELIERALPYQLGAETSYHIGPDGVRCTITMPVAGEPRRAERPDPGRG